ncbi:MAG TPA: patatin-like phospholipase family protein, partial [Luteimicrobium sp.]|nr:patatin-like phospholipase family protein [Luteimicrobium sp.]
AASCSSGLPYAIGEGRYLDGGYRRNENADLAAGHARVLVLSPFGGRSRHPRAWGSDLVTQVDELRAGGSAVETVVPDDDAAHLFGANAMDLAQRPAAARAGHDQGRALAERLGAFWA